MNKQLLSLVSAVVLVGCRPPTPEEVAKKTASDTSNLLREAWQSVEATNGWASVDDVFVSIGAPSSTPQSPRLPTVSNYDKASDSFSSMMVRVFTEANVTKREGASLTFQVRGVDVCRATNGEVLTSCADQIDQLHAQVRVSGDLDVSVLFGANEVEVGVVHLVSGKSISLEVDLANAGPLATLWQQVFNGQQGATVTFAGQGKLKVSLVKNAGLDFTLGVAAVTDLQLSITASDGVARTGSLGARDTLAQVHISGPSRSASATVSFVNAHYTGLLRDLGMYTDTELPADAFVAGLTAELSVDDSGARVKNLGLGATTSTLRTGSTVLISGDFNANLGRAVDITWGNASQGFQLTGRPGVTVDATFNLGAVTGMKFHPIEEFRNVHYTGSFTSPSSAPSVVVLTRKASSSTSNAIFQLVEGTYAISADVRSPCAGVDNVAACNTMKTSHMCGGKTPTVDCSTFAGNACWNEWYFDCVGSSWRCSNGAFSVDAAQRAASCSLVVYGQVAPRSFSAPTCLGGGSSSSSGNAFVQGLVAGACP
jgi:hypothetical protein